MITEIVIFIADRRSFIDYSLFWKIFYFLLVGISFMFVFDFSFGDVIALPLIKTIVHSLAPRIREDNICPASIVSEAGHLNGITALFVPSALNES